MLVLHERIIIQVPDSYIPFVLKQPEKLVIIVEGVKFFSEKLF